MCWQPPRGSDSHLHMERIDSRECGVPSVFVALQSRLRRIRIATCSAHRLCRVGQCLSRTIISWCTQCEVFEGSLAHQSDSATFPDMFSTWLEPRAGDKVDNGTHWHCMPIMAQTVQDTCTTDGRRERLDHPRTLVARACEALRASTVPCAALHRYTSVCFHWDVDI